MDCLRTFLWPGILLLIGVEAGFRVRLEAVFRPLDALLPQHGQPFAVQVEVDQREVGA